jgi:hypothetical protein
MWEMMMSTSTAPNTPPLSDVERYTEAFKKYHLGQSKYPPSITRYAMSRAEGRAARKSVRTAALSVLPVQTAPAAFSTSEQSLTQEALRALLAQREAEVEALRALCARLGA